MEDPELPTPFEKALIEMLSEHKQDMCLSAEELIELAEQGRRCTGYEARVAHVAACSGCFGLFRDLRRMEQAREQAQGGRKRKLRRALLLLTAVALAAAGGLVLYRILRHEKPHPVSAAAAETLKN